MKEREIYANIRTVSPIIIRLDGRAFHQLLQKQSFQKPYDEGFADAMVQVCVALLSQSGITAHFAYTFSDEISIYLTELPFQGRVEKLVSVLASYAASAFTISMNLSDPVAFDARIIPVGVQHIIPYLMWRQKEAWRNHMNGYSQAVLLNDGNTHSAVQKKLNNLPSHALHEICYQHGINLAQTPSWQRRGIMIYHTSIIKDGYNPITNQKTQTTRKKIIENREIPLFSTEEGISFVKNLLIREKAFFPE